MIHQLWALLIRVMAGWHQIKLVIEHLIAFDRDSLQILAGVFVWIAAGLLLRRSLTASLPWICVLLAIAWNETAELLLDHGPGRQLHYHDSARALFLALLIPTVLMLVARIRPDLFQGRPGQRRRR